MIVSLINNPRGLNFQQIRSLELSLNEIKHVTQFNIGGDKQDKQVYEMLVNKGIPIHIFPLISNKNGYQFKGIIQEPTNVSIRNRTLVDIADIVIAAPMMVFEFEDSAAWRTINYAISKDKEITILSPRGNIYSVWKNEIRKV